jgi:hypothetical protein
MKAKFDFRAVAVDETSHWNLPPVLEGATVFGVYMIAEGEATHVCSLTPSSGAEFLRNDFNVTECADPAAAYAYLKEGKGQDMEMDDGGEGFSYLSYMDCESASLQPYLSERVSFTMDSAFDDFDQAAYDAKLADARGWDSPQKARALAAREALRKAAWDTALEEFNANWRGCPVTDGAEFAAHRKRVIRRAAEAAERYGSTAPLLAASGVAAPLDIRI